MRLDLSTELSGSKLRGSEMIFGGRKGRYSRPGGGAGPPTSIFIGDKCYLWVEVIYRRCELGLFK